MDFEWELSAFSSHRSVNKFTESRLGPQYKYLNWYGSKFLFNGFMKFKL